MAIVNWYKAKLNALDRKHGLKLGETTDEELADIQRKTFEDLAKLADNKIEQGSGYVELEFQRNGDKLWAVFDKDYDNILITY